MNKTIDENKNLSTLEERMNKLTRLINSCETQLNIIENRKKSLLVFNLSKIPNSFIHVIFEALENDNEVIISPSVGDIEFRVINKKEGK